MFRDHIVSVRFVSDLIFCEGNVRTKLSCFVECAFKEKNIYINE